LHQQHRSQQLLRPTRLPFRKRWSEPSFPNSTNFSDRNSSALDEKIGFKPLSPDTQREIGQLVISRKLPLPATGFDLTVSEPAFEFLVSRGIHQGAWRTTHEEDRSEIHR